MRTRLSQGLLDNLVSAWSRLDRARPRDQAHVPALLGALDDWVRWAVRIDGELLSAFGRPYAESRRMRPGGKPLPGLHLAADLTGRHAIDSLVTVSAGGPALFYDVIWRRCEELPASERHLDGMEAYRRHLAGQAARRPASDVTTFLLGSAVADGAAR